MFCYTKICKKILSSYKIWRPDFIRKYISKNTPHNNIFISNNYIYESFYHFALLHKRREKQKQIHLHQQI